MEAYILCAGKQERFGGIESKMMIDINGKFAFEYLMRTMLDFFAEENVNIITSCNFPGLAKFISREYSKSNIIVDENPGNGTAQSLSRSFPWSNEKKLVCEGDIYFDASLIKSLIDMSNKNFKVIVSATDKIKIAPSHRQIIFTPKFRITQKNMGQSPIEYRNLGVYIVDKTVQFHITPESKTLIDVYRTIQNTNGGVEGIIYSGDYLHMAYKDDVEKWKNFFI